MFYTEGEDTVYEVSNLKHGQKVVIYLEKVGKNFVMVGKPFGTHLLEQIFDQDNNLISQDVKLNPYKVDTKWVINALDDDYD